MKRLVTAGAILPPMLGLLLAATAAAANDFEDIPYLQVRINQVLESEPTGAEVEWHNEATGNSGAIRVLKTYFTDPDSPCRDYERTTRRTGGADRVVLGTGCRDASGRWALKEQEEGEGKATGPASPGAPDQGAGETGGSETGGAGQAGGQGGTQSQSQGGTGSAGQAGGGSGQTGSGQTGSGQAGSAESPAAAPEAAPEPATDSEESESAPEPTPEPTPEPEAPAPGTSNAPGSGAPDFDLPTPSD